ncbi:polysaccharide deacetylase family protein [Planktotalea sp.]|uniref:polysaccharide deacetylase family protein n=1 Tax=Planktotalea sp. TaxID=2029877 RepID=UPI0035C82FA4
MAEVFRGSRRTTPTAKARLRHFLRHQVLSLRAMVHRNPSSGFIRCLYAHHVFDDERKAFEGHIKMLKGMGQFVSTDDALDLINGDRPVDGRYFHLSYDDGLSCLLHNAAPILAEAEVPAIVFVNSAMADQPSAETKAAWHHATNYANHIDVLDWDGLRQLLAAGFEIGAHTRTHKRLSAVSSDPAVLAHEVSVCKTEIETVLGTPCPYFAWPYGTLADVDQPSIEAIRAAGYRAAFGVYRMAVTPGNTNPFMTPRHHFEPNWPKSHVRYFAQAGMEAPNVLPDW